MQRNLCRFTHRTDEQANANRRDQWPASGDFGHRRQIKAHGEHFFVVETASVGRNKADAEQETKVANPINQEGFEVCKNRRRSLVPKTDKQIGHQADSFPTKKQLDKIVAHHQHQHGKGEQRDIAKETLVTRIIGHIAYGENMHHQ